MAKVEADGDGFRVESTDGRVFRAGQLMIAAGAWGNKLAIQFDEPVPLNAQGPQMAVTEPVPYTLVPVLGVTTNIPQEGVYLRQVKRGNIVFGGGFRSEPDLTARRAHVKPQNTLSQFEQIARIVPALRALSIIRVWSGVEGYLPDDIPIMGPSAKISRFFTMLSAFAGMVSSLVRELET